MRHDLPDLTQVNIIRTGQSLGFGFVEMLKELKKTPSLDCTVRDFLVAHCL